MSGHSSSTPSENLSRRRMLQIAAVVVTAAAGVHKDKLGKSREKIEAAVDIADTETRLLRLAEDLAQTDHGDLSQNARDALERLRQQNPSAYQDLMRRVEAHQRNPEANILDYVGVGVFAHGISQIIDTNIGHIGVEPYTELAAVLVAKYLTSNEVGRHHLMHELLENKMMTFAVLALVTLGENTGVRMDLLQKRIKEALASQGTEQTIQNIVERGKNAEGTLKTLAKSMKEDLESAVPLHEIVEKATQARDFKSPEEKRVVKCFVAKEMWVELCAAYYHKYSLHLSVQTPAKLKDLSLNAEQDKFCRNWLLKNIDSVVSRVVARFDSHEKIQATMELGAGGALFASATSPMVTTVAAASVVRQSGVAKGLVGEATPGYERGKAAPLPINAIPPFPYRIQHLIEDHVSNLSGLGGVGDPPFIAMMQKFGLKGFVAQLIATWPATAMNAEMSYAGILQEYYPYLTAREAHKIAVEQFARLVPEYVRLLACNLVNVFAALVGGAISVGLSTYKFAEYAFGKKKGTGGFANFVFSEGPMQRLLQRRAAAGKKTNFRLEGGVQFSLGVMAYELIAELMITEKPTLQSLTDLATKLEHRFAEILDGADDASSEPKIDQSPYHTSSGAAEDAEKMKNLASYFATVNNQLTALWALHTEPAAAVDMLTQIEELKRKRADTNVPTEQENLNARINTLTAEIHRLIREKNEVSTSVEGVSDRKKNVAAFISQRDQLKGTLKDMLEIGASLKDVGLKERVSSFVAEAKTKLMTLELSQLTVGESFTANPFAAAKTFAWGGTEMEHLKALLGPTRAEVLNALTFQADCVAMLRPVFQAGLNLLPERMHVLYIIMLFTAFNLFSGVADNLVATMVGLGIKPSLWPYILQAAIAGGANTRIGNMANLAGCSMEEFPLQASVCWYFVKQHILKAGVNLAYAAVLDTLVIPHFPILQLSSEEAAQHMASLQEEREQEIALAKTMRSRVRNALRADRTPADLFVAKTRDRVRKQLAEV